MGMEVRNKMNITKIKQIAELIEQHEKDLKSTQKPYAPDWNDAQISIQVLKFKEALMTIISEKEGK
jgi:hypothetical protein